MEQYLQGKHQSEMVEASKDALIDALSNREGKKYSPVRRAL
jgi:hypothetical protein